MKPASPARILIAASAAAAIVAGPLAGTALAGFNGPVYTKADSGHTEQITKGTTFKIRLKNCADCGDAWSFKTKFDSRYVKLIGKTKKSSATPPAVGGIDTDTWTYKVVGKGTTTVKMVQKGPSQKVIKRYTLTIKSNHLTVQ
ncbi:MAG TPA: protease inhibitor I42 family protein [Mycobacteriales bacterium]|nr:protease inhibitor I42 family protein [Mycobacteriales bacterium]